MGTEAALAPWVILGWGWQRGDRELLCVLIEGQFKAADVAAVNVLRSWSIPVVTNLSVAGWARPRPQSIVRFREAFHVCVSHAGIVSDPLRC
jgi:hypothetical protein